MGVIFLFFFPVLSLLSQTYIVRGPYLQVATQNSIIIRWRTNTATSSRIIYGTNANNLNQVSQSSSNTTEHQIKLTGLQPDTKYYYAVGNIDNLLATNANLYFYTLPPNQTKRAYSFWILGDCGTGNNDQRSVRDAFIEYNNNKPIDGMILLGDNAYDFGTDGQYQDALFNNMYENIISNTVIWPTPGNHDYYSGADAATQTGAYYQIFSMPTDAELGGTPSHTKAYYSFNIGNIHFISLDSYDSSRDSTSAMGLWLKQDLQQNQQEWTIAFWHHAPYTKGSHNSDNPFPYLDFELPQMREQLVPILERYGVDLILCGHSHAYERSFLLNGHYGNSSTLNTSHKLDEGKGDFITDCPYQKKTKTSKANKGTIYAVVGVSGKKGGTSSGWPHPVMVSASNAYLGSMVLTVNENRLDATFLTSNQTIFDQFTIIKNAGGKTTVPFCQGEDLTLHASFPDQNYIWQPGNVHAESLTIQPYFNSLYYGGDAMGCIKDTFQLIAIQPNSPNDTCGQFSSLSSQEDISDLVIFPNPSHYNQTIQLTLPNQWGLPSEAYIHDIHGRTITQFTINTPNSTIPILLNPGVYLIEIRNLHQHISHQIIINS